MTPAPSYGAGIGFAPTAEQRAFQETARAFAVEHLVHHPGLDSNEWPMPVYEAAFAAGLVTASIPEEYGGGGRALNDLALAAEEVAYGDAGVAISVFVTVLGTGPLVLFGTPEQQARWLPRLTERLGFCSFAWTEPEGSSNLFGRPASTVARPVPGGFRVTGMKSTITNAPVASFFSVFVRIEGTRGLSVLMVDAKAEGVSVRAPYRKLGQRASPTGEITLEDVFVPEADLVGRPGQGLQIGTRALARSRAGIGALSVGVARRARDLAIANGHARRASDGRALVDQQDYRFRLARLEARIEAVRALTWRAAWEAGHGHAGIRLASAAKLLGSELAVDAAREAVDMLGARGYLEGGIAEKLYRDAMALQIFEGPPAIQMMLIAETATRKGRIGRP